MKVIKITKIVSSHITHYMTFDDDASDDLITYEVENWCADEPSGQSRGYSYNWIEVTDFDEKCAVIGKEISRVTTHIQTLLEKKEKLSEFYDTLVG